MAWLCIGAAGLDIAAGWVALRGAGVRLSTEAAILAGAAVVVSVFAMVLPLLVLVRGNRSLVTAARRWAGGDLRYRAPVTPRTAVGGLAESLNQMAAALHRRDETRQMREEELADQAEKLATTARLAAGVAHELNNPLGGILLYANLVREGLQADDPRQESVGKVIRQAERARDIVKGLLDFARQSPASLELLDISQLVRDTLHLLDRHPQLQAVQVRSELSKVPLWVEADAGKLQQVLVNIILNALDAMRPGGVLTVRSGFCEKPGFCRVAVTDSGRGIPEEHLPHLFEPFFTTKEVGHGVGLGLAVSHGIVLQHRGDIEVQSQVGVGSTFRIILPLSEEE